MAKMKLYLKIAYNGRTEEDKCSGFLYLIGQSGRDIFDGLKTSVPEGKDPEKKSQDLFDLFKAYVSPRANKIYERYCFNKRSQEPGESIDHYVTELKICAKNCVYGDLEAELISDRMICGVEDDRLRDRLLRCDEEKLTPQKGIELCKVMKKN